MPHHHQTCENPRSQEEYDQEAFNLYNKVSTQVDTPVHVNTVRVEGARRTRTKFMENLLSPILQPKTLGELVTTLRRSAYRLEKLDMFDHVDVHLDASKNGVSEPQGVEVVVSVKEQPSSKAKTGVELGDGEAGAYASIVVPSILGGGERFTASGTIGTKITSSFALRLSTPINADPERVAEVSVYQTVRSQVPVSSFEETVRGSSLTYRFQSRFGNHALGYLAGWRQVRLEDSQRFVGSPRGTAHAASDSLRVQAGHSLKSAVNHTFERDSRDDAVLPTRGHYFRLFQELSGLGGDVSFVKHEFQGQSSVPISSRLSFTGTVRGGLLVPLTAESSRVNDRFYLGGPLSVRGFKNGGLGPRCGNDSLGGDVYWCAGASLISPLSTQPQRLPVYAHAWVNAGSLLSLNKNQALSESVREVFHTPSVAAGIGLACKFSNIRLECNFCVPIASTGADVTNPGIQIGMGMHFL